MNLWETGKHENAYDASNMQKCTKCIKLQKINIYCSISISGSQSPKYINFALGYTVQTLDEKKSK